MFGFLSDYGFFRGLFIDAYSVRRKNDYTFVVIYYVLTTKNFFPFLYFFFLVFSLYIIQSYRTNYHIAFKSQF